jgi:hypothetical protein
MAINSNEPEPITLKLFFTNFEEPRLTASEYAGPRIIKGNGFKWGAGCKALCVCLVEYVINSAEDGGQYSMEGNPNEDGPAKTLGLLLSSTPTNWLKSMFGDRSECQKMFKEENGSGKHKDRPIRIRVLEAALPASEIRIIWNANPTSDPKGDITGSVARLKVLVEKIRESEEWSITPQSKPEPEPETKNDNESVQVLEILRKMSNRFFTTIDRQRSNVTPKRTATVMIVVVSCLTLTVGVFGLPMGFLPSIGKIAPQYAMRTVAMEELGKAEKRSDLVVLTAEIDVRVEKFSQKSFAGINLGTTSCTIRALGNKVQFILSLNQISSADFNYDRQRRVLVVNAPAPTLNEDIVEVQTDPSEIEILQSVGWARLKSYSGQYVRELAERELRPSVIQQAKNNQQIIEEAKLNATEALERLLKPAIATIDQDVSLIVTYK